MQTTGAHGAPRKVIYAGAVAAHAFTVFGEQRILDYTMQSRGGLRA